MGIHAKVVPDLNPTLNLHLETVKVYIEDGRQVKDTMKALDIY